MKYVRPTGYSIIVTGTKHKAKNLSMGLLLIEINGSKELYTCVPKFQTPPPPQ